MRPYPGITAIFRLASPDDVLATLQVTMPVKQWKEVASQLSEDKYESWPLRAAITDLVLEAGKAFYHKSDNADA